MDAKAHLPGGLAQKRVRPARAWQRMLSGRRLDLLDPSPLDIEIEDIAHGLARVARWNGQTRGPHVFSVAQHALLVEAIAREVKPAADEGTLLVILLHDSAEYVIGDIISPFKAVLSDSYKVVERRILRAVHLRFGLPSPAAPAIAKLCKRADQISAYHEATALAGFDADEAEKLFGKTDKLPPRLASLLKPMNTDEVQKAFLGRFMELATTGTANERNHIRP